MTSEPISHQRRFWKPSSSNWIRFVFAATLTLLLLPLGPGAFLRADQVEMQNGDRYFGQVLSLDTNQLVLQSEVVGTLRLPRAQVAGIQFGARSPAPARTSASVPARAPATNRPAPAVGPAGAAAGPATSPEIAAALKQLGAKTNFIQQVQKQFLSDAGPEANQQFNDLVSGLMTGKLNLNDLRTQAKSMADQLRAAQKELGSESGWAVDSYLAILDHFLKETAPPPGSATNPTKAP